MTTFVDTSALFALLDEDDDNHPSAVRSWVELADRQESVFTTNYVIVESVALAQRRLGRAAATHLVRRILPVVETLWVDATLHAAARDAWLTSGSSRVSLVDHASFGMMRRVGIDAAFAFDRDFETAGFEVLPPA